ncbi:hypothetical protein HPP92_027698 [Vanilla planifolia]|uniref:Uncharacterized protein n=1 Tax=Vanilla planifolia TaxID=51239 RepID=A0A835P872_VANPL|nr:hypothetical protein HPP92_027698 [Vanilla planifolia]
MSHELELEQGHTEFSADASGLFEEDFELENGFRIMDLLPSDFIPHDLNPESVITHSEPNGLPDMVSHQHNGEADEEFLEIRDLTDLDLQFLPDNIYNQNLLFDTDEFYDPCDHFSADLFMLDDYIGLPDLPQQLLGSIFEAPENLSSHLSDELWVDDETYNKLAVPDTNQLITAPADTGTVNPHANVPLSHVASSPSWYSSTLWSLLDSVPSRPALASEGALISRAIERVSSFRTAQIHSQDAGGASGRRRREADRGFVFISVLVGLGALFWVLAIGAVYKVMKGLWGRFISS